MKPCDGGDQAEPESVSRRVTTVFEPVEALENMLVLVGGNSRTVIGDRDDRLAISVFACNDDLPSGAAMLDRIVHEIGDGVKNQITVAGHQHLTITDNGETGAVLFRRGVVQLDNLTGDFEKIPGAERPLLCLGLDLGNPRQ